MAKAANSHGMIAVDKMGGKVLFLNPDTYETEVVIDGFPRTVHELLVVPETNRAYVPIFGDGVHGRTPTRSISSASSICTSVPMSAPSSAALYRAAHAQARTRRTDLHHL